MGYQTLDVQPLAGALGAEIAGVDLSKELSNQVYDEIHQAFLEYQAIFFRDQTLTPQQQIAFGRHFGPPHDYPFVEGLPDAPEVFEILKTETDERNFGGAWHSDTTYTARPPLGTILYAHEVPEAGGDTMFANTYLAYESLSDGLKRTLDGLRGINSAALAGGGGRANLIKANTAMKGQNMADADALEAVHPVVRTHPETGRKALYINRPHTVRFEGWTEAESRPLIDFLCQHAVRPEFTCRFRWRPGSLAFWDNRCTQHFAIDDYAGQRRRMHRLTIEGEVPA